jgi:anti-sigma factor RsiW
MDPRTCDDVRNQDFALESLPAEESAWLEAHLIDCPACASRVEQYRALFRGLADLPLPAVPGGIADAVLARLEPKPQARRSRPFVGELIHRQILALPLVLALAGVVIILREPLALLFARMVGTVVAGGAAQLVTSLRGVLDGFSTVAVLVRPVVSVFLKLEPILKGLGEALRALPAQASTPSVLLSLATAILLARLLAQVRRERPSHAKP